MKIKKYQLENLIQEELKIFFENHGSFPDEQLQQQEGDINEIKSNFQFMYDRLLQHLGAEKLLYELIKHINPRMLRDALESVAKLYDIRTQ